MSAFVPPLRFFKRIYRSAYYHLRVLLSGANQPPPASPISHEFSRTHFNRAEPCYSSAARDSDQTLVCLRVHRVSPWPPRPPSKLGKQKKRCSGPSTRARSVWMMLLQIMKFRKTTEGGKKKGTTPTEGSPHQSTSPNPNDHVFATFQGGRRAGEKGKIERREKRRGGRNKRREFTRRASAFGDGGDGVNVVE